MLIHDKELVLIFYQPVGHKHLSDQPVLFSRLFRQEVFVKQGFLLVFLFHAVTLFVIASEGLFRLRLGLGFGYWL